MYFLLSPAKNLNEKRDIQPPFYTQAPLLDQAAILMNDVRPLAPQELAALMHVSDKIALLNAERNTQWSLPFTPENAKSAIYLFNGDVYEGIDAYQRNESEIQYIQQYVRILSGLYGVVRPLDLIQPYRLEMGTALQNSRGKNLYEFWGDYVTDCLNEDLKNANQNVVVNLASQEYFKVVQPSRLNAQIITPIFKDKKAGGDYKVVSFYAKRARGLMVKFASMNGLTDVQDLQNFDLEGYSFHEASSNELEWVFLREHQ